MKAYNLHAINNFKLEEVVSPVCDDNSVIVEVKAAGICGSDIPRIYYKGTYHYPLIPGHEFSGQVVEVGTNADKSLINKKVGIFPLIPCMKCACCQNKQYEMCSDYNYLGSRCDGGFAQLVKVPTWNLLPLPENVTHEQAAMLEPMAVAVHAIRRSGLAINAGSFMENINNTNNSDSTSTANSSPIAVCGLGTIGLLVTMFLREMGYRQVYGIGNKQFQKQKFMEIGFKEEYYIDSKNSDVVGELMNKTNSLGADVFFECVGKNETMLYGVESVKPCGTLMLVGNPASDMALPQNIYWRILRKQLHLLGTWNSSFTKDATDDWHYVIDSLANGRIHPERLITHRFNIDNLINGFEIMRDKEDDYIKIMGVF